MEMDRLKLGEEWKRCEAIVESYLQEDGCLLTFDEVSSALLGSGLAESEASLAETLAALQVYPGRRYTMYDVERAALLLTIKPQEEDIFTILVQTLDPDSSGTICISQLKRLLGKFGASIADDRWNRLQDAYAPNGDGKFTYGQLRNILLVREESKNHESGSDRRYSTSERA